MFGEFDGLWAMDSVTSPAIDLGDPMADPAGERGPNGGRVNMGAYGDTPYASMSDWPLSADINRDGVVDLADVAILSKQWLDRMEWAQ